MSQSFSSSVFAFDRSPWCPEFRNHRRAMRPGQRPSAPSALAVDSRPTLSPGLLWSPTPRTIKTRYPLSCSPHSPFRRTLLLPCCHMAGTRRRRREPLAATTPVRAPLATNVNTHPSVPVKNQTLLNLKFVITFRGRDLFELSTKHP